MKPKCIALTSGQSLLVEGVASRLSSHTDEVTLEVLSPGGDQIDEQLAALQPDIIILDARDHEVLEACSLYELFQLLPGAKVLMLDSERSEYQVLASHQERIDDTEALLEQILSIV